MNTARRTVTVALAFAAVFCALVLGLRTFAQAKPGPYDIDLTGKWQKLKPPYDEANDPDGDRWETEILKKHATKYCTTHRKKDGTEKIHCPRSQSDASQSDLIPVANTSTPTPSVSLKASTSSNVTQQISCVDQTNYDAVVATFDKSP